MSSTTPLYSIVDGNIIYHDILVLEFEHAMKIGNTKEYKETPHPKFSWRCSCQESPKGKTGQDHQYHGLNHGALGNVITLFGPHGILQ
jgi:hypothetical protein